MKDIDEELYMELKELFDFLRKQEFGEINIFNTKEIGKRIKIIRRMSGMSQEQLAQAMKIEVKELDKQENSDDCKDTCFLINAAKALHCQPGFLCAYFHPHLQDYFDKMYDEIYRENQSVRKEDFTLCMFKAYVDYYYM